MKKSSTTFDKVTTPDLFIKYNPITVKNKLRFVHFNIGACGNIAI
jgi:hypothetical protein